MNHILYIEKQYIALQKICHVIQMDRSAYRLFRSQTRQRVAVGVCDLRNANAVPADRVILPQRIQRHFHHLIAISRRTLIITFIHYETDAYWPMLAGCLPLPVYFPLCRTA